MMNKLKILWKNKRTWTSCFEFWYILMFPHLHYSKWEYNEVDEEDDAWYFWTTLNNFDNYYDED